MTSGIMDRLRTMNYEVAEAIAPTWERRRPQIEEVTEPVRRWMLSELAASQGETILELAAGVGDTGFSAAEQIGDEGHLITSDLSPAMLEAARRRGVERGAENVEYRVIDAERMQLEDGSVDGVLCRFGYMLMPDQAAALAETRRVLRPGGRLVLAVWGPPERNPFFAIVAMKLVELGRIPPPEPPPAPGIFSLAGEDRIRELIEAAGFSAIRTEQVGLRFRVPDVEQYIQFTADTAGPIGLAVQELSAEDRATLAREIEGAFEPFATGDGYELSGIALCGVAR